MPITALPVAPSRISPETFADRADALLGALPAFVTEANTLEANINAKEITVNSLYALAAAAGYVGEWSAQSGAATIPYSVSHLGTLWYISANLANVKAKTPGTDPEWSKVLPDYSCQNTTEKIQYPIPTTGYMLKASSDGSPAQGTNTDTDVADAVSKKHTQHTDTGTTATSFKINTGGNEAELQTTGLTADRDYTFPDIDTMLAGAVVMAQNNFEIIEYTA